MTVIVAVRRVGQRIAGVLSRIAGMIRRWTASASQTVRRAASRHRDRVADDVGYTRTVATAVTELATTLLPQPTLAAAVAILLTGWLSPDQHHTPRPRTPRAYDPEPEYDSYPVARRTGGSPPPPAAGSLWDRLH